MSAPDATRVLRYQLEHKSNLVQLVQDICKQYELDASLSTNVKNIKAFLAPLQVDAILAKASTVDAANALIVQMYGESVNAGKVSIPDDLNATKSYLTKLINTPGDNVSANRSDTYKDTFLSDRREAFDGIGAILNMNQAQRIETVKYLNYQSLFRDEYIVIDSRYQNKVNTDPTKMSFTLISSSRTKSDHGGVILGSVIKDIVEIEIYPFTIPYKAVYATFYNKITLTVNEWASSAFEAYEGGQFHFCFDIDQIDNNLIYLRPINATYAFAKPVNYIDAFTLSFGAIYPKIAFDADRMSPIDIDFLDSNGLLTFAEPHGLVTGDLVYITGFSTPDVARDVDVITEMNRTQGHTVVKKDNYTIVLNVDLTVARHEFPIDSGSYPIDEFVQQVVVYFASKRVQIQMRLKYLTTYA
jgi:hypothetical protein